MRFTLCFNLKTFHCKGAGNTAKKPDTGRHLFRRPVGTQIQMGRQKPSACPVLPAGRAPFVFFALQNVFHVFANAMQAEATACVASRLPRLRAICAMASKRTRVNSLSTVASRWGFNSVC